ncbi:endolytic transglycosylase MltG [Colwellia psychrerythraea]|uniref:Endolytic murein transglycosylase n=1 Tax=Colwellia psychrerythraea TaxID=28229 RepID=A0A099KCF2_COLPS|nr:endolytic transglycosylase MltG [Colwellia psychrerythraea]KGJ87697.1 aminodeoxychorismate lyase [Colwellia psychrerythraea]
MLKKLILLILLALLSVAATLAYQFDKALTTPLAIVQDNFLKVSSGSSISSFAKQLEQKQWITTRFWLRNYGRLFPQKANIKAGTYLVAKGTNLGQLLVQLVEGKEYQFSVTFIEGTRFKDALVILAEHPQIKQSVQDKTVTEIATELGIDSINPEGWLFPDTYAFTADTLDLTLLKRAYTNMQAQLNELWQQRADNLPYKTPYQALIMASIIEKETSYVAEQPLISSVFVNRLRKKMRLQTDPTIIYGLGDRYKGDITRAHKREKTAYNTYRINGLPPTPIALSGLSAIKATLHPATSDYFYFVSNAYGKHVFSKNLAEHNRAVRDYLKKQRQKRTEQN